MNYDLDMNIKVVQESSNEILKFTSESSELFAQLDDLKKLILDIDNFWISNNATKLKQDFLDNVALFKGLEAVLNNVANLTLKISNMRKSTEEKIEKLVNDL